MPRRGWVFLLAAALAAPVPAVARTESLRDAAHTVVTATEHDALMGWQVAPAGDFDGDGVDDLVAAGNNVAYVLLGGERGSVTTDERGMRLGVARDDPAHTLSVGGAGDVDGDGYDDVLVGAPQLDPSGKHNAGTAFLVFGRPGVQDLVLDAAAPRVARIDGAQAKDRAGYSVAGAGDVDGDGMPDVVVGSRAGGAHDRGAAYVVPGASAIAGLDLAALGGRGIRIHDPGFGAGVGYDVAAAGDVNGDGFDDVVVGAPASRAPKPPAAYVVYGSDGGGDVRLRELGERGWVIRGSRERHGEAGASVSGGHDVDGDGVPDVVVGAPNAHGRFGYNGAAFVVFARAGTTTLHLDDVEDFGFRIEGGTSNATVARAVALVPDHDGNGLADVLVGDPLERRGKGYGALYHLVGQASHEMVDLARLGRDGVRYATAGESFGGSTVAGAGDFDADGARDLVTSSPYAHHEDADFAGAVWVFDPVDPPANDRPPGARLISYTALQQARFGNYCWDGLCVDRRPAFPEPRRAGTGDRAHFRILYDQRPDDFGLTVYRELDEFGRPAGEGRAVEAEVRPVRHFQGAPVGAYEAVFQLPREPGDAYFAGFARWGGLGRGDVSWFAHFRLTRAARHTRIPRPPKTVLHSEGARQRGALSSHCWTNTHSSGGGVSSCSDITRDGPLEARRARAGARAAVRIHSEHRPDRVDFHIYREQSHGYPAGESRRVRFWLRKHRVDGELRAWEVRFRLPRRPGHVYPRMHVRWRGHGTAPYDWHLRLR